MFLCTPYLWKKEELSENTIIETKKSVQEIADPLKQIAV